MRNGHTNVVSILIQVGVLVDGVSNEAREFIRRVVHDELRNLYATKRRLLEMNFFETIVEEIIAFLWLDFRLNAYQA